MSLNDASYQTQSNSEFRPTERGSKTVGAKLHGQKEKNPNRRLRSPNVSSVKKGGGVSLTARRLA